jgi:hypothetical protein
MFERVRLFRFWRHLPTLALALYLSRALAEFGAQVAWPLGAVLGALAGLALIGGCVLVHRLRRGALPNTSWPALLLWIYVLYPAYDPRIAALVGAASLLAWLATRFPHPNARLLDGGVFAASLALYWLTLAPGLLPADAGEFQLVAARLGVAHPPGYPLYTLLGKGFTLLAPANPMRGLNLFSAVTTALAVTLSGRAARRLSGDAWAGLVAAATLAVAASVWSTATQASIRPLTAFFTALCVERLAAYRDTRNPRALCGFALAFGLGLTHHPSLAFPGLFFVAYLLLVDPSLIRQPRRWPILLGAFALGFLPWLYLPLRGAVNAPLAPADLTTWRGFWDHVLARGFSGDLFVFRTPTELADRFRILLNILTLQWHALILVAMLLAGLILLARDRRTFALLFGGFALHSFITMTYRAPQTVEYLIPAYVGLAILLGAGLGAALNPVSAFGPQGDRAIRAIAASLLLTACLALAARNWPSFASLARDESTRATAEALLEEAPPDAVILANWHWATPLEALRQIEGQRSDVEVVYVYPEGAEPLAQTWVRRIEARIGGRPVVVTGFYPTEFAATPYFFEPLGPGWLVRETPRRDAPPGMSALDHRFDDGVALVGVETPPPGTTRVGDTFEVWLAWRTDGTFDRDVTAYVHLSNEWGTVISGSDVPLPMSRAGSGDVLVSRHTLAMPPYGLPSPQGEYHLSAGLYVVEPDGRLSHLTYARRFSHFPAGEVTFEPLARPYPTAHPRHVVFANSALLRGYDWEGESLYLHAVQPDGTPRTIQATADAVPAVVDQIGGWSPRLGPWAIPLARSVSIGLAHPDERYVPLGGQVVLVRAAVTPPGPFSPGQEVIVDLTLLGARPVLHDDVIKVDLVGEGYSWRAQSDHIPATGAIPTLKWLWGWRVIDRHRLTVPTDAPTAAAHVEMLAYDHFTGQVLPLLDLDLARQGIAVPLYRWP